VDNVVVSINDFVGARLADFSKDSSSQSGLTHYYCGADPHYIRLYSETHARFDPLTTLPPLGKVVSIPDLVDYDEYRADASIRSGCDLRLCRRGQRCARAIRPKLRGSAHRAFGARMIDGEMRRRIAQIVPHVQRALLINRTIDLRDSEAATFAATLDGLSAGIFLVDADCRLVHANAAGHDMLSADGVLSSIGANWSLAT